MRSRTRIIAAVAVVLGITAAGRNAAQDDAAGAPSFQLVYHSDTRGYYRPCG